MGGPTDRPRRTMTVAEYEKLKQAVRDKWAPKLREIVRQQQRSELARQAMSAFSGVKLPGMNQLYERKLAEIHAKILQEIDRLPRPPLPPTRSAGDRILKKMPVSFRKFLEASIGKKGLSLTDDTTLKWMSEVGSVAADRLPTVIGGGIEWRFK